MKHNNHGTKVNYTRNILSHMYYMFSVVDMLLIISGIELNPGSIDNRTFTDSSTSTYNTYKDTKNNEIRNTLLKKAQSLNSKVDKNYEIVHERMT
jgi:hypothetical protein